MHGISSDDAEIINTLSQAFKDLKQSFDSGIAVQTTVVTFRIQATAEAICENEVYHCVMTTSHHIGSST